MKQSEINWEVVEKIAESIFPDEYETTTRRQRESMEIRISKGLSAVTPDGKIRGMHQYFEAALENMGMIMTALSIIVTWYTWMHPKKPKIDYHSFIDSLKNDKEAMQFFKDILKREIEHTIEKDFGSIIDKIDELNETIVK